jgi:hypothetical protein
MGTSGLTLVLTLGTLGARAVYSATTADTQTVSDIYVTATCIEAGPEYERALAAVKSGNQYNEVSILMKTAKRYVGAIATGAQSNAQIQVNDRSKSALAVWTVGRKTGDINLATAYSSSSSTFPTFVNHCMVINGMNFPSAQINTLGELAAAFQADQNQNGLAALITTVGNKLDSSLAATTYALIDSPTFTGTPIIPGYATSINLTDGITEAKDYTDLAIEGINNSLGGYQPEAEKNQASGYAGLDINSKILESVIPQAITTAIAAATTKAEANINGTYTNGSSSSNINKITYGTDLTPPSSGNSAGDIYIQY